jgi:hypothetical protein
MLRHQPELVGAPGDPHSGSESASAGAITSTVQKYVVPSSQDSIKL